MEILLILLFLAFLPAAIAAKKGYPALVWWIYGLLLFPIAFVHALLIEHADRNRQCPFCAEKIMAEARVCPHCQRDLPPIQAPRRHPRNIREALAEKHDQS